MRPIVAAGPVGRVRCGADADPRTDRDPLAGTDRLLVDGSNLLHALSQTPRRRPAGHAHRPAARGRSRPRSRIELVFDGPPERGLRGERIASGLDRPLQRRPDRRRGHPRDRRRVRTPMARTAAAALLVVTDDRELRYGAADARRPHGAVAPG